MTDYPLTVAALEHESPDIRTLTLVGEHLRPHAAGSHLVVRAGSRANAYSLLDDGFRPTAYRISVRRAGRGGGSDHLHDHVRVGDQLTASGPRSAFPPVPDARKHLLIAAGIGVTPVLSHLRAALRWNRSVEVIYGHRGDGAHLAELRRLAGDRLQVVRGRAALAAAIDAALAAQPVGTHAYACGPDGMIGHFLTSGQLLGWPEQRLHVERFDAPDLPAGLPFSVVLASDGSRLQVPAGISLLDVLETAGRSVEHMCRRGVCGQCVIGVRRGVPEHRDLVLSPAERVLTDRMYCCVSRAAGGELELDL